MYLRQPRWRGPVWRCRAPVRAFSGRRRSADRPGPAVPVQGATALGSPRAAGWTSAWRSWRSPSLPSASRRAPGSSVERQTWPHRSSGRGVRACPFYCSTAGLSRPVAAASASPGHGRLCPSRRPVRRSQACWRRSPRVQDAPCRSNSVGSGHRLPRACTAAVGRLPPVRSGGRRLPSSCVREAGRGARGDCGPVRGRRSGDCGPAGLGGVVQDAGMRDSAGGGSDDDARDEQLGGKRGARGLRAGGRAEPAVAAVPNSQEVRKPTGRCRRRELWCERREGGAPDGDLRAEVRAGTAVAQVRSHAAPAQHASVAVGDRAAHVVTCHRAALRELGERTAGFEDRLLGGAGRDRESDPDLLVCEAAELAHHQRRPLALGKILQIRDEDSQLRALRQRGFDGLAHRVWHILRRRARPPLAHQRDRRVVRDPEQPCPYWHARLQAPQRSQRTRHRRLQRILGILLVAHDRAAVAIQRLMMTLVEQRKATRVAIRGQLRKPLVAAPPQPEGPRSPRGHARGVIAHRSSIDNARARLKSGRTARAASWLGQHTGFARGRSAARVVSHTRAKRVSLRGTGLVSCLRGDSPSAGFAHRLEGRQRDRAG
jgi:hypothetical protein